jgi:class 3 adenylate cyclase/tetratricopeptide (TPR) repeat protein
MLPAGVKFCTKCGTKIEAAAAAARPVIPKANESSVSAERRQLTVMICDLVGSTALSARLDPEDMREIIGAYHRCCAEQITKAGGFVAKYMGDGVLAYFGYPRAHEDDAERAVRAGLGLIEAVSSLRAGQDATLQVRVGIATGLVVVGDLIGEGDAQERGVVGETPNLAARLQALAEPGHVVISNSTRRLTGGMFEYHDLGKVSLKGLADPVQAWQVLGVSAVESRFEAQHGAALTPLVGREEELELLMRRWRQARAGDGFVVLVSGEPGIGKSRLVPTLLERLSDEPHTRLRSFCSPHHQDTALYPTITQLERAAGFRREDTDEQRLDKLEAVLAQATNDLSEAAPLLAQLLSVPTGDRYPRLDLTPQKRKEKTFNALIAQLAGLAARQPVVMVYEDAHWIDPTSLELLDLTVDRVPSLPVLLIITFRPEFTPSWVGRPQVMLLSLSRLPHRQGAEMLSRLTGGKALPRDIADEIVERTDGVPLFIEELTKAVVESGELADAGDHYTATRSLSPLAIPTTLHASLLARLDRLAPVREVAQIGAALGRQFSHELISGVAQMPLKQLDDGLAQLVSAELVFRRGTPPDAEYTFKHALVRDAAYSTLLRGRRQQLHARIAETLERKFPEIAASEPALLALHWTEAALSERAVGYRLKAGQQSVARSAMTARVAQLEKGLDLLANLPENPWRAQQELDLRVALNPAISATRGQGVAARGENIARARALAEQLDRADYLLPLFLDQITFHSVRGELRLALSLAQQAGQISETTNDRTSHLRAQLNQAIIRFHLGEFAMARSLLDQWCALADPTHRRRTVAGPVHLAITLMQLGHLDQARARKNEALGAARELGHVYSLALALTWAAWTECIGGSSNEARRHADEVISLSNEHGFADWLAWGVIYRGWSLVAAGQTKEGLVSLTEGFSRWRASGSVQSSSFALTLMADAYAKLELRVEAKNCIAEAEQIIEMTDDRFWEAELWRVRGELFNATGDRAAAERNFDQALAVAKRQSAKLPELRASTSLARLWRNQGKRTEARELLAPVYGWFTEGFDMPDLKEAKALLEELS